jgi:hypothetical protein
MMMLRRDRNRFRPFGFAPSPSAAPSVSAAISASPVAAMSAKIPPPGIAPTNAGMPQTLRSEWLMKYCRLGRICRPEREFGQEVPAAPRPLLS